MKPNNLKTKIFLDSGDPKETKMAFEMLGFLDGQTTNPSLIIKNPGIVNKITKGDKFSRNDLLKFYKDIVGEISKIIEDGDISIEVYADKNTTYQEMVDQAHDMYSWTKNARIKLPIIFEGLKAAEILSKENFRINMTLCFSEQQAAATAVATLNNKNPSFVSPFIGRLNDINIQGVDLIKNILEMYSINKSSSKVLAASIRDLPTFLYCLYIGSDIVTLPLKVIKEWYEDGMKIPDKNYDNEFFDVDDYFNNNFKKIDYSNISLNSKWSSFDIINPLTNSGIDKFSNDWNSIIKN